MRTIEKIIGTVKNGIIISLVAFFTMMYCSYDLYTSLNRYALYVTFLAILCLFVLEIKQVFLKKRTTLIIALLTIAVVFLNLAINNSGYGSLAILIVLLLTILCSDILSVNKSIIKFTCFIIFVGHIIYLLSEKMYYNTNTYGYVAFAMLPFSLTFLIGDKTSSRKRQMMGIIISILIIILTFETIISSESRGALLGILVFFVSMLISNKLLKNKRVYNVITFFILIAIIGFVLLYVNMWKNGVDFSIPFTEQSLYSGREAIWNELLNQFSKNYILGMGSHYDIQSFDSLNVHNSMLYILVIYGSIVFVLFWILLYNTIKHTNRHIENNRYNKIFMSAILGMLIVSFFETNLEWADVNIYFILALIYCYSINGKDRKHNEKREI